MAIFHSYVKLPESMSVYQRVFLDLDGPQVPLSREDLIHQHVLYVLRKNPDVARSRIIPVAIHTAILPLGDSGWNSYKIHQHICRIL